MRSVWQEGVQLPSFGKLEGEQKTDVLIIGGGIAGLLTAYLLDRQGVDYILVEKDRICSGTTQNTTAKITVQHGLVYHDIVSNSGVETARKYLNANEVAFRKYEEMCRGIDCDFEYKDSYVYAVDDACKLEREMRALEKIGAHAEFAERIPLPFETVGGVKFPRQAQFHPLKFLSHVAKDLNIFEHTFVREMIGTTAVTDTGKITAERVVVTTHFPFLNKHGAFFLKLYQHRSYVIALENAADVQGMYVDENKKGMSFRNYKGMLLLGGGGHRTGKKGGNWEELRCFAKTHYPDARERFYWAAQDCMSLDKMPYIGQYAKSTPHLFVASGFNKWGVTGAMTAAMLLCDLLLGKENEHLDVFAPSRRMLGSHLFVNGIETTGNLLRITNKRCPHLGCALKWNAAEHSWDCPCHGSRFTEDGILLDNPANGNAPSLKKHD